MRNNYVIEGKLIHLGYFCELKEAEKAASKARRKYLPYSQEALQEV